MANRKQDQRQRADGAETIESALTSTEQFIERNRKFLLIGVVVIIVLVLGVIGYQRLISEPRNEEAQVEAIFATNQFHLDSFQLALHGDGNFPGFLEIADRYSSTPIGNLANYYIGISYMHLGEYQQAIDYLQEYSLKDEMIAPVALGAIGDCYVNLEQNDKGLEYYVRAAKYEENILTTPIFLMKIAMLHEVSGDVAGALESYQRIKDQYPDSPQAREVEKFIGRAQQLVD